MRKTGRSVDRLLSSSSSSPLQLLHVLLVVLDVGSHGHRIRCVEGYGSHSLQ
jgi:hypothetical protein